jgi:hypothetical protein
LAKRMVQCQLLNGSSQEARERNPSASKRLCRLLLNPRQRATQTQTWSPVGMAPACGAMEEAVTSQAASRRCGSLAADLSCFASIGPPLICPLTPNNGYACAVLERVRVRNAIGLFRTCRGLQTLKARDALRARVVSGTSVVSRPVGSVPVWLRRSALAVRGIGASAPASRRSSAGLGHPGLNLTQPPISCLYGIAHNVI